MKKVMNTSIIYFIFAMIGGVFYREFTKFYGFRDPTVLGVVHTHLMVLGVGLFLLIGLLFLQVPLEKNKLYQRFFVLYNISFPLMVVMLVIRGVAQVQGLALSKGANAAISGVAGLSHIGVAIALGMLLFAIKKEFVPRYQGGK